MKLPAAQVAGFLKAPPPAIAAALVYGPDEGLVRERAELLCRAVLGSAGDDPFRLALLTGDGVKRDPALLADEAAAQSLIGGRRVVRVRDADDTIAKTVAAVLAGPRADCLIVIEGGDLAGRSTLRKAIEDSPVAAAIACYADGPRELAQLVRDTLGRRRITIADDAVEYLTQNLGGDRMMTRQELEKLTLQAGDGGRLTLDEVARSVGDTSALAIEDVIYGALDGNGAAVEAALGRLFLEGESPVGILRAVQRHAQRLHLCAVRVAAGENDDAAVRSLRPPIFFKFESRFRQQLAAWPVARLQRLLAALTQAELDCKTTGFPDEVICRRLLSGIGRPARR